MDALTELCDLIAENPSHFPSKIAWISSRSPPSSSPRLTRSHIHALLAVARLLSKCPTSTSAPLLGFLRSLPAALRLSFWPASFPLDSIAAFFTDLLRDLSTAASNNPSLSAEITSFFGGVVLAVANGGAPDTDTAISHVFLDAVSRACPAIGPDDANRLVSCLLDQLRPHSEESISSGSTDLSSSTQSTPSKGKEREIVEDEVSSKASKSGVSARSSVDQSLASEGRGGRTKVAAINEESMDDLEKQEITFRMFVQVFDKAGKVNAAHQEQLRRRDWGEQGPPLKARINVKLSCCQAATGVQVKSILSLESDGKDSKDVSRRTLAVLLEAAEACIVSPWRKLRICEELFSMLLAGISQITVHRGGQLLRVLLIPLKPLVQSTCAQADTLGTNQGAMFESVTGLCCEIINFGWSKDRALVDTFIMGLASCIRERNDYEYQCSVCIASCGGFRGRGVWAEDLCGEADGRATSRDATAEEFQRGYQKTSCSSLGTIIGPVKAALAPAE